MNLTFGMGLLLILVIALGPTASSSAEIPLKKVTVAYPSYASSYIGFLLEKELGFFREEGLRPEFVLVRGGLTVQGLIAGNFDYVATAGTVLEAAIVGRQPVKIVLTAGMVSYWLVAQPDIRSVTDLKGKIIGISPPVGGLNDLMVREILKRHGLDPLKDAASLVVGASRERLAALTSGTVQAALFSPPFALKAVEMGYRKLAKAGDYVKRPFAGLGTREEKILNEPLEVSRMVRAYLKGLKFTSTHREYVVSKMMQLFNFSREEAARGYEALREESVPAGYLTDDEERSVIAMIKQAASITGEVPPDRVFDNRFVKQAGRELKGWRPQIGR